MKKITLCLYFLCIWGAHAQLSVTTLETPAQLVQNVLVGQGVTPTNILYNGVPANSTRPEVGHFVTNFNPTNLGVSEGMVMSTGRVASIPGSNTSGSTTTTVIPVGLSGDADLQMLTSNTVNNVTIVEFDFVATGLELNFDFVFASEEYPEWVYNGFNDVFGFFLSGTGINGPFSNNAKNLAVVPTTTTPVSINTINNNTNNTGGAGALNPLLYYNNTTIGQNPTTFTGPTVMFDGFTTLMRATSDLICGETYHIKLALANAGDTSYDSAVFLKNFRIAPMELTDGLNLQNNLAECPGSNVTISIPATSEFVTNAADYVIEWYVNTTFDPYSPGYPGNYNPAAFVLIPGEAGPTLNVTQTGVYRVRVYTTYGCEVAVDDIQIAFKPNPFVAAIPVTICTPNPLPVNANIDQNALIFSGNGAVAAPNQSDYIITYYDSSYNDAFYGLPTGIIPTGQLSNYTVNSTMQQYWIRLEELSGEGCVLVMPVTITVGPEPGGTLVYDVMCASSTLTAVPPSTNTLTPGGTYNTSSAGLVINPSDGTINLSTSTAGNYTVDYHLAASATCPAFDLTDIPVSIIATPPAPTVSSPTVCQNEAVALTATGLPGASFLWYNAATGGTGTGTTPVVNTATAGTYQYYVSQTVGTGCEGPRANITVTVDQIPAAPVIAAAPHYCEGTVAAAIAPLANLVTATGSLLWYDDLLDLTGSSAAPAATAATAGTFSYYVTQTVNNCESGRARVDYVIDALPLAPQIGAASIDYCQNDTAQILSAVGSNLQWYTVPTGGTALGTAPTPDTSTLASTIYYVSQTVNGCEGPRAAITVNISAPPAAPSSTAIPAVCEGTAVVLTDYLSGSGNYKWYTAATGGSGSTVVPMVNTNTAGSYQYYVSQTVGSCESARTLMTVTVNAIPSAPVVAAAPHYCVGTPNASIASLSALVSGTTGTLSWYDDLSDTTPSANPTAVTAATAGTFTYYVTQTINNCESGRVAVSAVIDPLPGLPSVADVTYCQNDAPSALSAGGANLQWYAAATGGTALGAAPVPVTATAGDFDFYVSQTQNNCEGPRARITVHVLAPPAAPSVLAIPNVCAGATVNLIGYVATPPANLRWYTAATGGTGSATAISVVTTTAGVYDYYVSQVVGNCESARSLLRFTVNAIPSAPVVAAAPHYCVGTPNASIASLSALVSGTTGTLSWYDDLSDTTPSANPTAVTAATAGTFTYYVTQTINNCESGRVAVSAVIDPLPGLPSVADVTYCQNDAPSALSAGGANLQWYAAATGGTALGAAPVPVTATAGDFDFYVSQTQNNCEGPRARITVHVLAPPAAPSVLAIPNVCAGATVNLIGYVATPPANLRWYTAATGGTGSATAISVVTTTAGVYDYYVSQVVGNCESARSLLRFTVNAIPSAPVVAATPHYCVGTASTAIPALSTLISSTTGTLSWYDSLSDTTPSVSPTPISTSAAATITYYVTQTVNNCESSRSAVSVVIDPLPATPQVQIVQPSCSAPMGQITVTGPLGSNLVYALGTGAFGNDTVFTVNPNASYFITVKNTLTGCTKTSSAIVIQPAPSIPATPAVNASDVCVGESIMLTTAAVAGATYSWTGPNGFTSSDQNPVIANAASSQSGLYQLVIYTTADCPSNPGGVNVVVNPIPEPKLAQDGIICFNSETNTGDTYLLDSGLNNTLYDFEWFVETSGTYVAIPAETQSTYGVTAPGNYGVRATHTVTGCVSPIVTAPVGMTSPPLRLELVVSPYFVDHQNITAVVSPVGNYEYQLDDGAWQISNTFTELIAGEHTVKVRNSCGQIEAQAVLIDYPRFFTPNGDGYNDHWNIFALSTQANAKIYIFDRYGKLLKMISPSGKGWDGTFNQRLMPGTDYWFTVEYDENNVRKEFKSHFALKR